MNNYEKILEILKTLYNEDVSEVVAYTIKDIIQELKIQGLILPDILKDITKVQQMENQEEFYILININYTVQFMLRLQIIQMTFKKMEQILYMSQLGNLKIMK